MLKEKTQKRIRRHRRIRAKIYGTEEKPRFSVYRSNKHIYAQLIDDKNGKTIISASDIEIALKTKTKKQDLAREVGKLLAKKAGPKKVKNVVFDRGGFLFTGRVKALADGAREGGLSF